MRHKTNCAALLLAGLLTLTWSASVAGEPSDGSAKPEELVFLSWSEYINPDLVKEFEQKFDAKVKQVYFETDELRNQLLVETSGRGYDVVVASGGAAPQYIKRGWVTALEPSDIPNRKHIDPRWLKARSDLAGHGVPYLWGTLGIAYRRDLVKQEVTTWRQFFEPPESLRGKILMIHDSRDTVGPALKALGHSFNSSDAGELGEAERLLLAQRPFVKEYSYIVLTEESALVTGDVWMAMVYSGDGLALREHEADIAFVVPEEGTVLWMDWLFVMETSKKKRLAMAFINFLNEPKNAARLAVYLNYATPNAAAKPFLPKDHVQNPNIYPGKVMLEKSEFYEAYAKPRSVRRRNSIFAKLLQ